MYILTPRYPLLSEPALHQCKLALLDLFSHLLPEPPISLFFVNFACAPGESFEHNHPNTNPTNRAVVLKVDGSRSE